MKSSGARRFPVSAEEPTSAAELKIVITPWPGPSGQYEVADRGRSKSRGPSRRISLWISVVAKRILAAIGRSS